MPIHFGTDGWRAVISDSFTFDNLRIVAQAIADAVASDHWDKSATGGKLPDKNKIVVATIPASSPTALRAKLRVCLLQMDSL